MNKTEQNGKSLESWIWDAACSIRGAKDAPKFKEFILPLIFTKRLCDVFDDEINRIAQEVGSRAKAFKLVKHDKKLVRFFLPLEPRNPDDSVWSIIRTLLDSRYRLPAITIAEEAEKPEPRGETYIPISPEGEAVKQAVRQPIQNRRPVGYNRGFLDAYRPNDSFYLTPEIRQQLRELGRSPDGQRPAGTYARQVYSRLLIDLSWNSSRLEGNPASGLCNETAISGITHRSTGRAKRRAGELCVRCNEGRQKWANWEVKTSQQWLT
jgi:hypothetical protein